MRAPARGTGGLPVVAVLVVVPPQATAQRSASATPATARPVFLRNVLRVHSKSSGSLSKISCSSSFFVMNPPPKATPWPPLGPSLIVSDSQEIMYLAELEARKKHPVRVGVVGIGRMGRGVVDQVGTMPGMRVRAAADVDLGRAEACLRENGADPVVTDQLGPAQDALRKGRPVATADSSLMAQLELDAIVEST